MFPSHYEDSDENVLEDVSFCIGGGQTVADAGSSGIGKTTVVSLIARFYDACSGRVLIDGADIRTLSLRTLRQTVGIVQQEVYIFNGTIRENIRYGREDATDAEIIEAAKLAGLHGFITSLAHGYDSLVGTKGIMLSGGQRQRLSIARLFLKDPKILRSARLLRERGRCAALDRAAEEGPHDHPHRAPAFDGAQRGPNFCAGRPAHCRSGHARSAAAPGRRLCPAVPFGAPAVKQFIRQLL